MQTISEFDKQFDTDEQCRAFLMQMRWPNSVRCPRAKARRSLRSLPDPIIGCARAAMKPSTNSRQPDWRGRALPQA